MHAVTKHDNGTFDRYRSGVLFCLLNHSGGMLKLNASQVFSTSIIYDTPLTRLKRSQFVRQGSRGLRREVMTSGGNATKEDPIPLCTCLMDRPCLPPS